MPTGYSEKTEEFLFHLIAENVDTVVRFFVVIYRPLSVTYRLWFDIKYILQIEGDGRNEGERNVDVMLSSEKLNAMLDGLGKIKDQLEAVSDR